MTHLDASYAKNKLEFAKVIFKKKTVIWFKSAYIKP